MGMEGHKYIFLTKYSNKLFKVQLQYLHIIDDHLSVYVVVLLQIIYFLSENTSVVPGTNIKIGSKSCFPSRPINYASLCILFQQLIVCVKRLSDYVTRLKTNDQTLKACLTSSIKSYTDASCMKMYLLKIQFHMHIADFFMYH